MSALERLRRRLRSLSFGLALGVVAPVLVAGACKPAEAPRGPLDEGDAEAKIRALEAYLDKHPDDAYARRDLAHLYWIHRADAEAAIPILDALAEAGDPVAQASRLQIADARLDRAVARRWAQALIEGAAALAKDEAEAEAKGRAGRDARKIARKRERAGIDPAGPIDPALRFALAELGARYLDENHGALADDDENFVAFFTRVDLDGLPVEVSRPLLSQRAAIARRLDDPDYRSYYDREGCVRAWTVGAATGTHGPLELRELAKAATSGAAIDVDAAAILTEMSCVVRVWNPRPHAGARRIATTLEVPGERLRLELSAQEPIRAYVDGVEVYRGDRYDRWPARRVLLDVPVAPGSHRLEVDVALPRDKAWVLVRATDHAGRPVPAKPAPAQPGATPGLAGEVEVAVAPFGDDAAGLAPQIYGPWHRALAASDALADGDSDRAERYARALERFAPRFAEAHTMIALFEREDPSRERTASAARERQALEAALDLDPSLEAARVRLLELSLDRGEISEVIGDLQELAEASKGQPTRLDHLEGDLLRFRAYLARGSESLAEAALAEAAERNPRSCEVLKLQRQLAQSRGEVAREDELVAAADHCPGTLTVRAGLAERRGQHKEALRLLDKALGRSPDNTDLLQGIAAVAIASEDYAKAERSYARLLELNPYAPRERISVADLLGRAGEAEAARDSLREAIALAPSSSTLHEIGDHLGIDDDLESLRVDGAPIIAEYAAAERPYEGASEVLVLDRSAARIYANGSARMLVHTIAEVRTKEAIDKYGELSLPEGARVLTLHSVKPDGEVIEPESIAGKDGLSLRGLEIGDFVEYEIIVDEEPHGYLPGYVDIATFRFQSYNVPFHVSELVVMHPSAMPIKVESRGDAPKGVTEVRGDQTIVTWRVRESKRRGVEPYSRDPLDELPSIRVHTELDLEGWLDALALRVIGAQRSNPELRGLARKQTKGAKSKKAKLNKLWSWVLENVEEAGDISISATQTLSARKGNRLMLLRALLREAGVGSEVWIGRNRFGPSLVPGGHPMPESYEAPMLLVDVGDEVIPVVTNSKTVPLGYLPASLAEAPALRLRLADDEPPAGEVTTPAIAEHLADVRRYDLDVTLNSEGDGSITGTITLQGMEAIAWREGLRSLDRDRLEEAFERAELAIIAQGAALDLTSLDIDNERALQKPLVLRFTADARGFGVSQGGDLVLRAAVVPMNIGLGYANLPERTTGMVIPYAPVQEAVVKLTLEGATIRALPDAETVTTDVGGYTRVIDGAAGDSTVTLRTRSRLDPGVIEAADYEELVDLTRSIRAAEDEVLRAR